MADNATTPTEANVNVHVVREFYQFVRDECHHVPQILLEGPSHGGYTSSAQGFAAACSLTAKKPLM